MHPRFVFASTLLTLAGFAGLSAQTATPIATEVRSADHGGYIPQIFPDPLCPASQPSSAETQALLAALNAYQIQGDRQNFSALENFVLQTPLSPWSPSLLIGMGRAWYDQGRYSRAIQSFEQAFQLTKSSQTEGGARLHTLAGALYAKMLARVGRRDELDAFFQNEPAAKATSGEAVELLAQAKGGLWGMNHRPELSFRCGSMALANICREIGDPKFRLEIFNEAASPRNGFSLPELVALGEQAGFPVRAVKRVQPDAAFITPAVVHWKIGHYAAITGQSDGRFLVTDPTFGENRRTLMSPSALAEECSGFFLIPADTGLPAGWAEATPQEIAQVRGKGFSNPHDSQATATGDEKCPDCEGAEGANPRMAGYSITAMLVSLNITDTPIEYHPPLGLPHVFTVTYNEREAMQPNAATYGNFSPKWSWNWGGSLTVRNFSSEITDPGDIDVSMPGGGGYTFKRDTFDPVQTTVENGRSKSLIKYRSKYQRDTRIRLTREGSVNLQTGSTVIKYSNIPPYVLEYPDGSKAEYGRVADLGTDRRYFLSRLIDPQGNATQLVYDQNFRLTQIIPPSLMTSPAAPSTIQYDTEPTAFYNNPYVITKVTTPDGRSAKFAYDQHGTKLVASTDPLGMSSVFEYGDTANTQRVTKLHTPYGTSSFRFGESTDTNSITRYRWIEATDATGATERVEFNDGRDTATTSITGYPYELPLGELPNMKLYNSHANQRNTFYWDKRAYALTSFASRATDVEKSQPGTVADYAKADVTHWLIESGSLKTSRLPEWKRHAGESFVFYNYQKNSPTAAFATTWTSPVTGLDEVRYAPTIDESAMVSVIGRLVRDPEGGSALVTRLERFAYNDAGRITQHRDPDDRETLYTYDASLVNLLRVDRVSTRGAPLPANWTIANLASYGWATQLLASFTYDITFPRLIGTYTNEARKLTSYSYNSRGQTLSITESQGGNSRSTAFQYTPTGLPSDATASSAGYLAYVDGPLSGFQDRQTFQWENGVLKTHTDESGYTTTISSRDAWLRPLTITYPDGSESFSYQELPHPAAPADEESMPSAPAPQLSYTVPGLAGLRLHRLARHTARDGQTYYYRYDNLARPTSIRDATGAAMLKQSWCACGSLEWFSDRKGQTTTFAYYNDGRLQSRTFPAVSGQPGNTLSYTYDIAGRLASMTNARGQQTLYRFTRAGLPRAILHPPVASPGYTTPGTYFGYDQLYPRVTTAADITAIFNSDGSPNYALGPQQAMTVYAYHPITPSATLGAGKLSSVTTTAGSFTAAISYAYDNFGRLQNRTYAGRQETYAYDLANRPTTKTIPGFGDYTFAFDAGSARLQSIVRSGGLSVTYSYLPADQANALRLSSIQWKVAATSAAVTTHSYGYKTSLAEADSPIQAWRIQSGALDNQWIFDYSERPEQELVSAIQTGGPSQLSEVYSYGYDEAGNRRTEQTGTQVSTTEHNARNQATTRTGQGPLLIRATVSPAPAAGPWLNDTITMLPESTARGGFSDAMSANTYRAWVDLQPGNRVIRIEARDSLGRSAVQHHRVTVPTLTQRSYQYDADGNLTAVLENSVVVRSYAWDTRNRLVAWGDGPDPAAGSFVYDSAGNRLIEKNGTGTITHYWVWEGANLLAEHDGNKTLTVRYYPEGYERVTGPGTGRYFYTRDHLGSIRELADANNNVVARYAYDPFGRRYQTSGTEVSPLGFTGHLCHQGTDLWLTHFRVYDADQGKWLSRDPVGERGGINIYAYVGNIPTIFRDKLGLDYWLNDESGHISVTITDPSSPTGFSNYSFGPADGSGWDNIWTNATGVPGAITKDKAFNPGPGSTEFRTHHPQGPECDAKMLEQAEKLRETPGRYSALRNCADVVREIIGMPPTPIATPGNTMRDERRLDEPIPELPLP